MKLEEWRARLDPKTAARVKTAEETKIERLPLASYGLTKALNGGIAKKRITMLYGNPSAGKSLLMLESVAKWQRQGLVCAWVDVEDAYDKVWSARVGVDNDELILIHAKSSGRIEAEIKPLLEGEIDVIVVDSISQILPEAFVGKDGSMNDQENRKQMGAHAKAITALVTGISYLNENTAVVFISQTTTEIGQTYTKQIPHGGKRTYFAASQIVKLQSSGTEKEQIKGTIQVGDLLLESPIGRHVDVYVEKNKLGPQSTKCAYDIYYAGSEVGIDYIGEVVDDAVKYSIIEKTGAWFNWQDQKWQGKPKVISYFKDNPESLTLVEKQIHTIETGEI